MNPRPILIVLVAAALLLPMAIVVLFATGRVLGAMQDIAGQTVLIRISQGCGIVWVLVLVALVIGLSIDTLGRGERPPRDG